jgi:hypothetical protein
MNIQFNYKRIIEKLKVDVTIIFWIGLIVLLLVEFFVLAKSYAMIAQIRKESAVPIGRQVRVNFEQYENATRRIEQSINFEPQARLEVTPFGIVRLPQ